MIRGTTAQFKFKIPYELNQLEWVRVKFWQPNNPNELLPITKTKSECTELSAGEVCVCLTSEQTARFSDKYKAIVQLRAQPLAELGGPVFACRQRLITVYPMLDDMIEEDIATDSTVVTEEGWVILDGQSVG